MAAEHWREQITWQRPERLQGWQTTDMIVMFVRDKRVLDGLTGCLGLAGEMRNSLFAGVNYDTTRGACASEPVSIRAEWGVDQPIYTQIDRVGHGYTFRKTANVASTRNLKLPISRLNTG